MGEFEKSQSTENVIRPKSMTLGEAVSEITGELAALILKRHLENGGIVEIPSLGIQNNKYGPIKSDYIEGQLRDPYPVVSAETGDAETNST